MRALLLVVDVQNGFLNAHTNHVLPVIKGLCESWPNDIVFTRYHNYPGSQFERLLNWYKLRDEPDTHLAAELEPFLPRASAVVDKMGYTALVPEMRKLLTAGDYTDVVLCGLDTETCVLKSAVDVFEFGLTPWLVSDACASNGGPAMHRTALRLARRFIGAGQLLKSGQVPAQLS